jgi:hypothetical protein
MCFDIRAKRTRLVAFLPRKKISAFKQGVVLFCLTNVLLKCTVTHQYCRPNGWILSPARHQSASPYHVLVVGAPKFGEIPREPRPPKPGQKNSNLPTASSRRAREAARGQLCSLRLPSLTMNGSHLRALESKSNKKNARPPLPRFPANSSDPWNAMGSAISHSLPSPKISKPWRHGPPRPLPPDPITNTSKRHLMLSYI